LIVFFSGQEVAAALRTLRSWSRIATPTASTPSPALAYSPRARAIGSALLAWHLLALVVAALPQTEVTAPLRDRVGTLAGPWMSMTRTRQSWAMWATVPVENIFLKAVIVHEGDEQRDLRTDLYAAELRPPSPFGYDRWWKIAERIIKSGAEAPYRPAYARWLCRTNAGNRAPVSVELRAVTYSIPTPAENRHLGGADPDARLRETAVESLVFTMDCP
jgi:hypothetical protein